MDDILDDVQLGFPLLVKDQYINILDNDVSSLRQANEGGKFLYEGKELCVAAYVPEGESVTVVIAGDFGWSEGNGGWDHSVISAGELSKYFGQDEYYHCVQLTAIGNECFMEFFSNTCWTYKIIIEYYEKYPGEPYLTRQINLET